MLCPHCGEKISIRARPKRPLPGDFEITNDMLAWARQHVPSLDVAQETMAFRDYWAADGGVKADWTAAWRMWLRKAAMYNSRRKP